ncbi:MAG: hypothetical protein IIA59_10475 [Candidatus Marinimicrobia bacterium]|nr:hypothetical protein [Candidatus Neomarinimicrobiota bacterium]
MPSERPLEPLIVPTSGETIRVMAGSRVRYSNPFEEEADYWSICIPAFSVDSVYREDD